MLRHKCEVSRAIGRNLQNVVATLDYPTDIADEVRLPTRVTEGHIAEIVSQPMHDGLTGLVNHSCFYGMLELELKRFLRHGTAVSLILLGIANFKQADDQWGHLEGDRAIRDLAGAIRKSTRESDICNHYGGEEFGIIQPMTVITGAVEIAERIRAEGASIAVGQEFLTVSLGIAMSSATVRQADTLVKIVDQALYQAQTNVKNQTVRAGQPPFFISSSLLFDDSPVWAKSLECLDSNALTI